MAYTITSPEIAGLLPIASFDSGTTMANGSSAIPTPPLTLGMIVQAVDPTFGAGEFILLAGVASTAVGSLVIYNTVSYTTTLCPVTANLAQPVAVAMSANIAATTFGWYQIGGVAVVSKSAVAIATNVAVAINSTAKIGANASGKQILGARTANSTVSATTTQRLLINRPHMQGRVT
jgi:drug/metabolite transporter (DMT)-like permease